MWCIIYSRLSVKKNDKGSIDAQESICQNYATKNNFKIKYTCYEHGSAYNRIPKKLQEIISNERNITLIVKCVDRFSRNYANGKKLLELAKNNNISIHFVQEKIKYVNNLTTVLSHIENAENEVKKNIQRRKDIRDDKIKKGLHISNKAPYGFTIRKTHLGNVLLENEYEQKVIELIKILREDRDKNINNINTYLKYLNPDAIKLTFYNENEEETKIMEGYMTFPDIKDLLNSYKITNREKKWTESSLRRIIIPKRKKSSDRTSKRRKIINLLEDIELDEKLPENNEVQMSPKMQIQDSDIETFKLFREFQEFKLFKQYMNK